MHKIKISQKGQLVIPSEIRKQLSIEAGMTLSIEIQGDHIVLWLQKDIDQQNRKQALKALEHCQNEHKAELKGKSDAVSLIKGQRR